MSFKTQKEIYEALLAGKKIRFDPWGPGLFIRLDEYGHMVDEKSQRHYSMYSTPNEWSLYEEPNKVKTVTLYRYTYRQEKGSIAQSNWISQSTFWLKDVCKLLKTETKEIQIEDA